MILMKKNVRNLTMSALFLALGLVLPIFTGQIPQIGSMLLPMHIPVFLCGLICGGPWGALVGLILPLLRSVLLAAMVGFGTGMYDGFFGPGAGTFMTLLFNSVLGLGIIKSCGTTKVVNLASNVGALITYGMNGNVLVGIGIKCTIFAILGSWVGSGLALKNGAKIVRPIMIVAMLLLLLKIASDMFLG